MLQVKINNVQTSSCFLIVHSRVFFFSFHVLSSIFSRLSFFEGAFFFLKYLKTFEPIRNKNFKFFTAHNN